MGDSGFDAVQYVIDNHLNNGPLAAGDLNNDGYVDLVVPTEGVPDNPGPLFILLNNNAGNDWEATSYAMGQENGEPAPRSAR